MTKYISQGTAVRQIANVRRKWRGWFCDNFENKDCNCIGCQEMEHIEAFYNIEGLRHLTEKLPNRTKRLV